MKPEAKITLKRTDNNHLFGLKLIDTKDKLDLSKFNCIIGEPDVGGSGSFEHKYVVSASKKETKPFDTPTIHVGGMCNLYSTIKELNKLGMDLKVVPDMDHLTIGGLYSGIGGGACTFREGAFFCIVRQVEVLTGNGEVVV